MNPFAPRFSGIGKPICCYYGVGCPHRPHETLYRIHWPLFAHAVNNDNRLLWKTKNRFDACRPLLRYKLVVLHGHAHRGFLIIKPNMIYAARFSSRRQRPRKSAPNSTLNKKGVRKISRPSHSHRRASGRRSQVARCARSIQRRGRAGQGRPNLAAAALPAVLSDLQCEAMETGLAGWGGRIRTSAFQNRNSSSRLRSPTDFDPIERGVVVLRLFRGLGANMECGTR